MEGFEAHHGIRDFLDGCRLRARPMSSFLDLSYYGVHASVDG
jgi:hypothetical protein